jgi:hypothetical protein
MLEEKDQIEETSQEETTNEVETTQDEVTVVEAEKNVEVAVKVAKTDKNVSEDDSEEDEEDEDEDVIVNSSAHDDFDWTIGKRDTLTYSQTQIDDYIVEYDSTLNSVVENEIVSGIVPTEM